MDNRDTCDVKDIKKMDASKVWKWRIMHVKKYSRRSDPFYHCNRIGLDFNVTSNKQTKIDIELITNAVILEICDFAKTVNKSKKPFIIDILENNFNLGLENEKQRTDFTARVLHKIKELVRKPPKDKNDIFTLFETSSKLDCESNDGVNIASTEVAESFQMEMDDTDDSELDDISSQATSKEHTKTGSLPERMDGAHGDDGDHETELKCSGWKSAEEQKDVLPLLFPYCEKIGLNLDVGAQQSLDPGLLSKGVMLELVQFTRILTASLRHIVLGVLEHNFELDLKSKQGKNRAWFKISQLLKRRNRLSVTLNKINSDFRNELFSFQTHPYQRIAASLSNMEVTKRRQSDLKRKQEKRTLSRTSERPNKRRRRGQSKEMETLSHCADLCSSQPEEEVHCPTSPLEESDQDSNTSNECGMEQDEMENYFNCPQEESDLDTNNLKDSGSSGDQDHFPKKCSLSSDYLGESQSSHHSVCASFLTTTDISSSSPTVNANVNPPFANQSDERGLDGGEELTQTPRNEPDEYDLETENYYCHSPGESDLDSNTSNKCDMEQDEMENYLNCPQGESDLDTDNLKDFGSSGDQGCFPKKCSLSSDHPGESQSGPPLGESDQDSNTSNECDMETENDYHCPLGESDHDSNIKLKDSRFSNQCEERGFDGGEELTQSPRNASDECDMEQDEMGTKNNMWKLRANRVKQILSATELGSYRWCENNGLDFNVGFHSKQNMSVDFLSSSLLLEVAKFSLAMNSSQQNFIMEILEYNFDLNLQSERQRNSFTCEIMNRVRRLRNCEDAVKFSSEVFELPVPMRSTNKINQTVDTVKEECDDVPVSRPHSLAEVKEHVSQKSVDLYPFCKEIGLKLHVNSSRPNKKLDINKLTNGAMTEVANFAEELCGTFEQICVDILRHNFDLGLQSEETDLARNIMAWIPVIVDNKNLSNCQNRYSITKVRRKDLCKMWKLDCQKKPNVKAYSAGPSQAAKVDRDVGSSAYNAQNEHNLKLWQLRANHVQHILSVPHEEHCPFYSFSRCKKVGIDFNVGSGVKQNLDPKILTNGLMVELKIFATALLKAQKHFITEILEYNFHLYFKTELHHAAFIQEIMPQVKYFKNHEKYLPFELPDTNLIPQQYIHCPKCYQSRKHKRQDEDEFDPGNMPHPHLHTMSDAVSADANYSAQKHVNDPTSTVSAVEDKIMDSYPHCKKAGFHLCVDRDRPKVKLDRHVLTFGLMSEVIRFSKKLCGTKNKIVNDVLEHNFNIDNLNHNTLVHPVRLTDIQNAGIPGWFNEVFDIQQYTQKPPGHVGKITKKVHGAKWMEGVNRRQLTRRSRVERAEVSSHNTSVLKSKGNPQSTEKCFPFDTDIVLYRDMVLKSGETGKLDSKLLGTAVCVLEPLETTAENQNDYTCPLGESDLDSDKTTDSEDFGSQDHFQNPSSDLPRKSESSRGRERTQSPRNAPDECDMEQEQMGTESNMWKVRANRVKQILSATELGPYPYSKKFGLDFNVGFHSKQNMSVDSLSNSLLHEVAKFSLAMNSSQQNFIMEILEYNFDLNLQSERHRNSFTCEIMNRVRRLRNCEHAVKFSDEVFELPDPMRSTNKINQTVDTVKEECDDVPVSRPHSLAEVKEHVSQESEDLYPFCKEIGLKLHVNSSRPNKKLDINKLTNGAMTEVTNFAEELCGTFEQICVDILRHNFDLGLQSEAADLPRNIVARIPVVTLQQNLKSSSSLNNKLKSLAHGSMKTVEHHRQNAPTHTEYQKELNLKLWQLRANHVQHILSAPHEEHCPLYSYSSCKKIGIDFNVGSGVKQNLDPKLLTNAVMVELNTFALNLLSAHEHFITEILEYNFHLHFKNELHRSAFANELHCIAPLRRYRNWKNHFGKMKQPFELPDTRCLKEHYSYTFCPKCYQVRDQKHHQGSSDPGHMHHPGPHTMSDAVSADANCSAQKPTKDPSSTFSAIEERIMDSYPHCKKIGLNLCGAKDRPKAKFDMHVLTGAAMNEVVSFARVLRGNKSDILPAVLEHNFNIHVQIGDVDIPTLLQKKTEDDGPEWFDEVFVVEPKQPRHCSNLVAKMRLADAVQGSQRKETVKKRQLALQAKEERAKLLSHKSVVTTSTAPQPKALAKQYPICTKMGVDLEMKSKVQGKLSLLLLTRAMVSEIHKYASLNNWHYLPNILFDILDHNFDLSSQHHRRWEFSIATASKINSMVKSFRKTRHNPDKVFKLPFEFAPRDSQSFEEKRQDKGSKNYSKKEPGKKKRKDHFVRQVTCSSDVRSVQCFLYGVNEETWCHEGDREPQTDSGKMVQLKENQVSVGCGTLLQEKLQIKKEEYDPCYTSPHYDNVKAQSNTARVLHSGPDKPAGPLGCRLWANSASNLRTNLDAEGAFKSLVPVEAPGSKEHSKAIIGHDNESTLVKEEEENVSAHSMEFTGSEAGIKQE